MRADLLAASNALEPSCLFLQRSSAWPDQNLDVQGTNWVIALCCNCASSLDVYNIDLELGLSSSTPMVDILTDRLFQSILELFLTINGISRMRSIFSTKSIFNRVIHSGDPLADHTLVPVASRTESFN